MYTRKNAKKDFKIGFLCGLAIFGTVAVALILILNL